MASARSEPTADAEHGRNRLLGYVRLAFVWAFAGSLAWLAETNPVALVAGLVLAAAGESIRCWSAGCLVKSRELITCGPYQYVRNPLYLGRLLILTGVCIAATLPYRINLVALAFALLVFFVYYLPRKERVEPERLERLHGDAYRAYRAAVPSIFPRLTPYGDARGSWRFSQFVVNEEYNMVVALCVFFAVLSWRSGLL